VPRARHLTPERPFKSILKIPEPDYDRTRGQGLDNYHRREPL
jgi:hypothetical protein